MDVEKAKVTCILEIVGELVPTHYLCEVDQCSGRRGRGEPVDLANVVGMELRHVMKHHPVGRFTNATRIVGAAGERDVNRFRVGHDTRFDQAMSSIKTYVCRFRARSDTYHARCMSERVEAKLQAFVAERDWSQFHTPENLAKSIAIEAGELLECFQWSERADLERVVDELADVLTYCNLLAQGLGVNPDEIVLEKLERTRDKYPADQARGRSTKYEQL